MVLCRGIFNGEQSEHHYWNRIDGVDLDLTRGQCRGDELIEELWALDSDSIRAQQSSMHAEMADRVAILRQSVTKRLSEITPS